MNEVVWSCPRCGTELEEGGDGTELFCETCNTIISDGEIAEFERLWGEISGPYIR